MEELIIKEREIPCEEIVEVSCELEVGYQDEKTAIINNCNESNITTQSAPVADAESDENVPKLHRLHSDGDQGSWNGFELYDGAETDDEENVLEGTRPSVAFLRDKLGDVKKGRSNANISKIKDKVNVFKDVLLACKEITPDVKEEILDIVEVKVQRCNEVNSTPDKRTHYENCSNNNNIESRYDSDIPMIYLGPNDSYATIKSIACDNSEPIIVIVRNVDSDEPVCEPIHMPSSRNANFKVLTEIQKLDKKRHRSSLVKGNNLITNDPKVQRASKNMFPEICLTDSVTFKCVVCGLQCSNRKAVIEHVKSHSADKKSFECPTCSRVFTQQCNLKRHMRCHSGERPFGCPYCKKQFADQGYLTTHLRYHTNTKPYTCHHCAKSFFDRSNYVKHLKSHSGEKPYPCRLCEKSFLQQSDLKRHTRVHSGERPFKCGYCERSFTQHGDLTTHLRHHTGERPFICSDCQKTFANKRYLNSHVKGRVCFRKKANASLNNHSW